VLLYPGNFGSFGNALAVLETMNKWLRIGINSIGQRSK
jgi:hypothetical protein